MLLPSAAQCRAARALLNWTQTVLAEESGLARKTICDFEAGKRRLQRNTHRDISEALMAGGAVLVAADDGCENEGVRLRSAPSQEPHTESTSASE